jgi:hypothetical protein
MKKTLALIFGFIGWFAVIAQFYLMHADNELPFGEMVIQFLSYFTILTNIIVAGYFTFQVLKKDSEIQKLEIFTAITIYILIVGIIYQVILRSTWNPTGFRKIVDELLHTIIPLLTLIYWLLYENKSNLNYKQISKWTLYPLIYFFYILIRGNFSGFYPYPFVDVNELGFTRVLINSFWILVFFVGLSVLFVRIGKMLNK